MTSLPQPLHVAISRPFKDRLWKHYNDILKLQDHQLTPTQPTGEPVAAAWAEIPTEVIVRAFRK